MRISTMSVTLIAGMNDAQRGNTNTVTSTAAFSRGGRRVPRQRCHAANFLASDEFR